MYNYTCQYGIGTNFHKVEKFGKLEIITASQCQDCENGKIHIKLKTSKRQHTITCPTCQGQNHKSQEIYLARVNHYILKEITFFEIGSPIYRLVSNDPNEYQLLGDNELMTLWMRDNILFLSPHAAQDWVRNYNEQLRKEALTSIQGKIS
jgi:hypothetical protein